MKEFTVIDDTAETSWLDDANCLDSDLNLFFVESSDNTPTEVINLCFNCKVQIPCLKWAYANNRAAGYYGGLSGNQRAINDYPRAERLVEKKKKDLEKKKKDLEKNK